MREHPLDPAREAAREAAAERGLARLGGLARAAGSREVPEAWRERVLSALSRESPRSQTRASLSGEAPSALPGTRARRSAAVRVIAAVAACLALVVAVAGAVVRFRPEAPLAYAIDDVPSASSYVRAGRDGAVARFNDGTVISFAPGARGRVVAVTAHGARVSVDEGKAHFAVVHRPGAEWTVEAGPFTVAVTGTEFDVIWVHEHLDLVMQAGTVSVRGPLTPQGVALQAGQHLAVDVTRGELTITESSILPGASATSPTLEPSASKAPDDPPPAAPDPAPDPTTKRSPTAPSPRPPASAPRLSSAPAPTESQAPAPPSFRDRVARGDFAAVITEAEARGVDAVVDGGSLADVAALADAARYAGKDDLARRALLAVRSRFVGSAEARSAAFLLGRMAQASSPDTAVGWYDTYLTESPEGPLAPEALGRKMVAVKAASGAAASRPIAAEYLRRYPRGAFAEAANEILAGP
jgi:ferric-dicitrate binding protein FerR (iron transport regulator)